MAFNIKNEETHAAVKELAALTGESQAEAVAEAVRERLVRVRQRSQPDRVERILAIADDMASRWTEPWKSTPHGDLLYDETGLPR
ncbi:MAG: type II toxin-antitoxin system VapB family antitoxin [Thermocrispum sp.]